MSDLIDRQAAIETVRKAKSIGQAHRMLVQLPSAHPDFDAYCDRLYKIAYERGKREAVQWIPCSERMPKSKEYEDDVLKYYLVQNEFGDMMVCSWDGKYWEQMYQYKNVRDKVVAWMPLPEAYKEHDDD